MSKTMDGNKAPIRIELMMKVLQTSPLPLGYGAKKHAYCGCLSWINITNTLNFVQQRRISWGNLCGHIPLIHFADSCSIQGMNNKSDRYKTPEMTLTPTTTLKAAAILIFMTALLSLASCSAPARASKTEVLRVKGGESVTYLTESGEEIQARYYSLSDGSLHFVKLTLPDGKEYTLPNVMSASGARYTDDSELVWWTKDDGAFAEMRAEDGEWILKYADCRIKR